MELNCNFLLMEHEMQVKQVVESHEMNWVNKTLLIEESSEIEVSWVHDTFVIELNLVEISLCVVEFVNILLYVELG